MSILTIAWSMCAAASFMLALLHLLLWYKDRKAYVYLLSMLMAVSAGAGALSALALMNATSIDAYRVLIRWENQFVYTLLLPMIWFVQAHQPTARRWMATVISILWSVAILVNWLSPYSLVYTEITCLRQMPTFWGERFTLAEGPANPWVHLSNLASVLIVVYVLDAAIGSWRAGDRHRAFLVGGSVTTFIVLGGIHAPLVDAGVVETPYMISFAFLAIPDPVELRETVDDIVRDDRRTGDLIQHLRLMLSKGDGNRERFQVYDIIEEVLAITGAELETLGISVEQELAPNLPAVEAPTAASTRA